MAQYLRYTNQIVQNFRLPQSCPDMGDRVRSGPKRVRGAKMAENFLLLGTFYMQRLDEKGKQIFKVSIKYFRPFLDNISTAKTQILKPEKNES